MADMDRLAQLMRSGCTLVLDALDTFDTTMELACRALQWWARELVQVNTYLTTADAPGFSMHWDDHDVVIVQLGGEKSWEVRAPSRRAPMYRDAERNTEPSTEVVWAGVLRTGEVMHIPRGYWHQATRADQGGGYSLHVTFGIVQRTGVDWAAWLADRSREAESCRLDLDRWGTDVTREEQARCLAEQFGALARSYPPEEFLTEREQQRPPPRHVATFGVFGPPAAVVCVTEFPPRLDVHADRVEVTSAGKVLSFAPVAEAALRLLLSGQPAELAEVSATTNVDARVLAVALLKEGVCAEMTEGLLSAYTATPPHESFSKLP